VTPARILVLGSGGREHALAWRLARDTHRPEVLVAPGNDGMARDFERLAVRDTDPAAVVAACRDRAVGMVVVGPESALAAGVADALGEAGVPVFGASRAAARLESSKWFAKEVMREAGVPTAGAERCVDAASAREALHRFGPPHVVKADGLAAGKGVLVTRDATEAERFVRACLEGGAFGESGRAVVIEEHLAGEEASVMAVCDGRRFVLLPPARDYKRAGDGDLGPNTGGMGSYAPAPSVSDAVESEVAGQVVAPVLRAMQDRGTPFRGALYCGLMLTPEGARVIEFNARFGDPESQSVLPLVTGSLTSLLYGAARGELEPGAVSRAVGAAVTLALVDADYPEAPRGGGTIEGLDGLGAEGVTVFHAGTRREAERWVVRGGRAAYLTAVRDSIEGARDAVYAARAKLSGNGWRCRADIAATVAGSGAAAGGRTA
jgi:phosphoribosylamine--glycine ligase